MIAFKTDPVWRRLELRQGEGVSLRSIDRDEIIELHVCGPSGEDLDEILEGVPRPSIESSGLCPDFVAELQAEIKAHEKKHGRLTMRDILDKERERRSQKGE